MKMRMIVLLLSVCILGSSEGTNPCNSASGSGWEAYNGHCYYHSTQRLNWIGAQLYCRRHGGNLVHIDNAEENDWLSSKYTTASIWIGATDQAREGNWRSIATGEIVSYTNWKGINPNNYRGNQDCGTLNWGGNGHWDDDTCSKRLTFICELDYRDKRCGDSPCNAISKCAHTTLNGHFCIAVGCDDVIPDLVNGAVASKTFSPPSVTFQCNSGYSGSGGSNTITCPPGGKWSTLSYQCGLAVNGGWGFWQEWSQCYQASCWYGSSMRTRYCNNPLPSYGGQYCSGSSTEANKCLWGQCSNIRLVNGTSLYNGRVELNDNGHWGTVCDNHWGDQDATVICKMLGFYGTARGMPGAFYGEGTDRIWLTNVSCAGYESNVLHCQHSTEGQTDCQHSQDASVICT